MHTGKPLDGIDHLRQSVQNIRKIRHRTPPREFPQAAEHARNEHAHRKAA
ncbi:MAG: hypothetical protein ABGU97_10460 [Xylella fastidiosa subsp. multiplex]